jgi:hypothetical protein
MHVRIPHNQRTKSIPYPIAMRKLGWQRLERDQEREHPHLAHQSYQEPLVDFLGDISPKLKLKNEKDGGGDYEEVGVECGEAECFEGQSKVICWGCLDGGG